MPIEDNFFNKPFCKSETVSVSLLQNKAKGSSWFYKHSAPTGCGIRGA
jgi:hypothetical protein